MKANKVFKLCRGILFSGLALVVVVGCSPIVREAAQSEILPLQSAEQYERDNAVKILEQVVASADPAVAETASQALILPEETDVITPTIQRIVNALPTFDYPSVGVILNNNGTGYFQTWCTATLIGCDTVLTAAHCVQHNPQPQQLKVFFQNAGLVNVTEIRRHPDYSFPNADIALLRLEQPVNGIRPSPFNVNEAVESGAIGTIVGFGRSGGALLDYGLKRYGIATTASCTSDFSNDNLICWNFLAPIGPAGEDSNTCNADSGGPFFVSLDSGEFTIAGVTSGGTRSDCLAGDHSYDARVSRYSDWINANSWNLSTGSCGYLPPVSDANTSVQGGQGDLTTTVTQGLHSFDVVSGTQLLRITMNGEDPGINNFNLYVRAGSAATTADFDCASTNKWQYEVCEIPNPTPGQWFALVDRVSGRGSYQVVATVFGGDDSNTTSSD